MNDASKAKAEKISDYLKSQGWACRGLTRLGNTVWYSATKEYDTAVGPRQASIGFGDFCGTPDYLRAEYYSEGRNVLEANLAKVGDGVETDVAAFVAGIEKSIDQSFARRLLLAA